ncbi:hypothetical protein MCC01964_02750 [Bifidobacteriaceae bacterium MCC01964]|nr:hypothetical protein MCC01964_02750 [Bifidobacteriaceae bacterium MCC01964]
MRLLPRRSDDEILSLTGAMQNNKPTFAGMMTLGDYPQRIYPNLCITAIAVNGTVLQPDDGGERFIDDKRYEGTIAEMLEGALGFVARNGKTRVVIRDGKRTDILEYPETAVREIITNALMHRALWPILQRHAHPTCYVFGSAGMWNPGGVYGGQSINDLGYANMPTRNPTLVSILEIEKIAENRHLGIPVIRDEARTHGVRQPEFIDQRGSFLVRFFNSSAETNASDHDATPGQDKNSPRPADVENTILAYCAEPRLAQEIANHVGRSLQYTRREYIRPMVEAGKLSLTLPDKPKSKYQRYRLTNAA